ncbi:MAG: hypothetical protein V1747_04835 [Candidatus Omnitrophota bacterium]
MGVFFGSAVIGCLASFLGVKKLEKKRAEEVLLKFKDKKIYGISSSANFFGQESLGMAQVRGNGVLVLTENELFFQMWAPRKELSIKNTDIREVKIPRTFLGKTKGKLLLNVLFKNKKGNVDSAAWLVNNLSDWQSAIDKIVKAGE